MTLVLELDETDKLDDGWWFMLAKLIQGSLPTCCQQPVKANPPHCPDRSSCSRSTAESAFANTITSPKIAIQYLHGLFISVEACILSQACVVCTLLDFC